MKKNNITKGESSIKLHVVVGAKTLCKKKSLSKISEKEFKEAMAKYPELCCKKCASIITTKQ